MKKLVVVFGLLLTTMSYGEETPAPKVDPKDEPPTKLFAKPYDFLAGFAVGIDMLNAVDVNNGGKADLSGINSGFRLEGHRVLKTVEHTAQFDMRIVAFPKYSTTRLINVSQMIFPGINWQTRFLSKEDMTWIVGGGFQSIPTYSNLAVTTVTMDGAYTLMPYGGVRMRLPGLEEIFLTHAEGHVGLGIPLVTKGYQGSIGFWQRVRVNFEKPWGDSGARWFEGRIDVVHSGETTNLESQSQFNITAWIFVKWRLDENNKGN